MMEPSSPQSLSPAGRVADRDCETSFGRNFLQLPVGTNPIQAPSGEKNGAAPPSVPRTGSNAKTVGLTFEQPDWLNGVEERATIRRQRDIGAADGSDARGRGNCNRCIA